MIKTYDVRILLTHAEYEEYLRLTVDDFCHNAAKGCNACLLHKMGYNCSKGRFNKPTVIEREAHTTVCKTEET